MSRGVGLGLRGNVLGFVFSFEVSGCFFCFLCSVWVCLCVCFCLSLFVTMEVCGYL